jgi:glucose/arabinose dehydrogenase
MGEDLPPDSLHVIESEQPHFGFPYCHAGTPDPDFTERECDEFFQFYHLRRILNHLGEFIE